MKYALCVGINSYPGAELSGCINDANDWAATLRARGFEVITLMDSEATFAALRESLIYLVAKGHYRDRIVFTYSGHGTYGRDTSGDEPDLQDEAICPVDVFTVGPMYDDEIGDILGGRRYGVRCTFLSDSCYSGTVNRAMATVPRARARAKFLPTYAVPPRRKPAPAPRLIGKGNVLVSGCLDTEYSYDAWFGDRPNGAFSRFAIDTLDQNPTSYNRWLQLIHDEIPSADYPQTPALSGSVYRRSWQPLA